MGENKRVAASVWWHWAGPLRKTTSVAHILIPNNSIQQFLLNSVLNHLGIILGQYIHFI